MKKPLFSLTKDDFRIDTFRATGPGGQHRNRTNSAVRITHLASGAAATATEDRDQRRNRKVAFQRLVETPKFRAWIKQEVARLVLGTTIEESAAEQMAPENIRLEVQELGRWVPAPDSWRGEYVQTSLQPRPEPVKRPASSTLYDIYDETGT